MKLRRGTSRYFKWGRNLKAWAAVVGCVAVMGLAGQVTALPLTIGDSLELGTFVPGLPAGTSYEFDYLNALIPLPRGGSVTVTEDNGKTSQITRSLNIFATLPAPTNLSQLSAVDGQFTLPAEDAVYLAVHYGGGTPAGGWEVWYVGGHNGESVTLPDKAFGGGLSGVTVFGVPDGGTTLLLLGGALSGLALLRRRLI